MKPVRVLIVDDSLDFRRQLRAAIARDPGLEIVGTAADGKAALECMKRASPDVVTLDLRMPRIDGMGFLGELAANPNPAGVVIVSAMNDSDGDLALAAMERGADDCWPKPRLQRRDSDVVDIIERELLPRLRALGSRAARAPAPVTPGPVAGAVAGMRSESPRPAAAARVPPLTLLTIGVSTGGPEALRIFLSALPADFPLPIAIVQHMPADFVPSLVRGLDRVCALGVAQARGGEVLRPGMVRVAPGGHHLRIECPGVSMYTELDDGAPEHACRPAVDVLFRSAARACGASALGLMLTGMGRDGYDGSRMLVAAGGELICQDEESSAVWGMPGLVARAGLALAVLPLPELAGAVQDRVRARRVRERAA